MRGKTAKKLRRLANGMQPDVETATKYTDVVGPSGKGYTSKMMMCERLGVKLTKKAYKQYRRNPVAPKMP